VVYIVPKEHTAFRNHSQDHFPENKDPQLHLCENIKTYCLRFDRNLKSTSLLLFGSQFSAVSVPKPGNV